MLQRTLEAAGDAARSKEGTPEVCDGGLGAQTHGGYSGGLEAYDVCPCLRMPAVAHLVGPGTPRISRDPCF